MAHSATASTIAAASGADGLLPITPELFLDPVIARSIGASLNAQYYAAKPFPHIVMDHFLPEAIADTVLANFPADAKKPEEYANNYTGIQELKRQVAPNNCNAYCRNLFAFFNSAPFLQFIEGLTGIEGLIADPYFNGGGFHETSRGGKLGIHADFRIHEQLHLVRRLNLLIYLNTDWLPEFGGNFEMWDTAMKGSQHSIAPLFNRCVVFNTTANSYHGHPEPLTCPPDRTRKSIALYYYTASQAVYGEVPADTTMYVARPTDSAFTKKNALKLRLQNYARDLLPPFLYRKLRAMKHR